MRARCRGSSVGTSDASDESPPPRVLSALGKTGIDVTASAPSEGTRREGHGLEAVLDAHLGVELSEFGTVPRCRRRIEFSDEGPSGRSVTTGENKPTVVIVEGLAAEKHGWEYALGLQNGEEASRQGSASRGQRSYMSRSSSQEPRPCGPVEGQVTRKGRGRSLSEPRVRGPIGLVNPEGSNSCWLNSGLQCLENTRQGISLSTSTRVLRRMTSHHDEGEAEDLAYMNLIVGSAIEEMTGHRLDGRRRWNAADHVRGGLEDTRISLGPQRDPADMMMQLGPIGRVRVRRVTVCGCGHRSPDSGVIETVLHVRAPPRGGEVSLEDLLAMEEVEEELTGENGYGCPECRERCQKHPEGQECSCTFDAKRVCETTPLSDVICIQIKRRSIANRYVVKSPVTIPPKLRRFPGYYFNSCTVHESKTVLGGHYVAYRKEAGGCFRCDDTRIRPVKEVEARNNAAGLVFYCRDGGSKPPTGRRSEGMATPIGNDESPPIQVPSTRDMLASEGNTRKVDGGVDSRRQASMAAARCPPTL